MNAHQLFLLESLTEQLVVLTMKDYQVSLLAAIDKVYSSRWYEKILDEETGLLCRSALYHYEHIKKDL